MPLPADFAARTRRWLDDYPMLEKALHGEPPVSIRINPARRVVAAPPLPERVKWCETGYYLDSRPAFTFDPMLHGGAYYVQEASSMFLEQVVRQYVTSPVVCLDLCAAPGGKSTHLSTLLPSGSVLVANEVIRSRCRVLTENVLKWGAANVIVTNSDPAEAGCLTHLFDMIVADMPCSGEGMFRKDTRSRHEWSAAQVRLCADRQRRIVHDVWEALRPGGLFVYSTCTFNREENEDNVRHIAETFHARALPLTVGDGWRVSAGADDARPSYRFFPHRTRGEGFFLALLRKPDAPVRRIAANRKNRPQAVKLPAQMREWLREPERFRIETFRDVVHAIPEQASDVFEILSARLPLPATGIPVGCIKGRDAIPSHGLALSTSLNAGAFPSVEAARDEAVRYLQKAPPALPDGMSKGLYLITYGRLPLGFARNIGTRVNNLYPQEWRIRSRDVPPERPPLFG